MSMAVEVRRPPRTQADRQCTRADGIGKVHHATRAHARQSARYLRRNGETATVTVYRCPCGYYCVGRGAR